MDKLGLFINAIFIMSKLTWHKGLQFKGCFSEFSKGLTVSLKFAMNIYGMKLVL